MTKREDERALKDIFVVFLSEREGVRYEVVAENVPNRPKSRDFDYLLSDINSGDTLALEITLLPDSEEELRQAALRDSVNQSIRRRINSCLEELPGGISVEMPYTFSGRRNVLEAEAVSVADRIITAAMSLDTDQPREITSAIGTFRFWLFPGGGKFLLISSMGGETWSTHAHDVAVMLSTLVQRLPQKNEQLDTQADRRVLLIGRMAGIIDREAIAEALEALRNRFNNIDELYVCYRDGDVERYW